MQARYLVLSGKELSVSDFVSTSVLHRFLFGADISGFDYVVMTNILTEEFGVSFKPFYSVFYFFIGWVPRSFWPEKPEVIQAYISGEMLERGLEAARSPGLTYIGDLYINGGMLAVLVGLLVLGCLHGWAYKRLRLRGTSGEGILLYAFFAAPFIMFRASIAPSLMNVIEFYVFLVPALLFLRLRRPAGA